MPAITDSSPDLTPKRQRATDAASSTVILAQAAATLESAPSKEPHRKVEKTLGKVSPRTRSPRSAQAALSHGIQPTPKAAPSHLVQERQRLVQERIVQARLAAEAAETATFGSGASPDRLIRDATMEEQIAFVAPVAVVETPEVVVGVATPTPIHVTGVATPTPDEHMHTANVPSSQFLVKSPVTLRWTPRCCRRWRNKWNK